MAEATEKKKASDEPKDASTYDLLLGGLPLLTIAVLFALKPAFFVQAPAIARWGIVIPLGLFGGYKFLSGLAKNLRGSPRELYLVLFAKFLESIGLFSLLYTMVLWLSFDFGMGDVRAGLWFGAFSMGLSICAFFAGFVADSLGFRTALISAFACSFVARGILPFAHTPGFALIVGLVILSVGAAAGVPVMNVAMRRYTTEKTRSFGFSVYYLSFNLGAAASGFIVDRAREAFKDGYGKQMFKMVELPIVGATRLSAYGMVLVVGFGCSFAALLVSLLLRKNVDLDAQAAAEAEKKAATEKAATEKAIALAQAKKSDNPYEAPRPAAKASVSGPAARRTPWMIAADVMAEKSFWRFMLFVALLTLVKLVFQHYHATFPKYALRELGEDFPLGKFQSINPVLIIFLVPIATALTRKRGAFNTIVLGAIVTAASVFILCLPASMPVIIGAIVLLSIGEALWSPRVYEYTAIIAPRGKEASYMGLSALPFFFAKMIAGPMSGYLLATYCPKEGLRHSWVMWAIIGAMTAMGPILIWAFRGVIEKKDAPTRASAEKLEEPPTAAARARG